MRELGMEILKCLDEGAWQSGWQICQKIEAQAPHVLKSGNGLIYPILHRLEHLKLTTGQWVVTAPTEVGPKKIRRLYALTKKGREYRRRALEQRT